MIFTIILLIILTTGNHASHEIIDRNNNIIIRKANDVKLIEGIWTVLLTVNKPHYPNFEPWITMLESAIKTEGITWPTHKFPHWENRLKLLKARNSAVEHRQALLRQLETTTSTQRGKGSAPLR